MKKHLVSFTNLLAVVVSLATFAIPVATQAQVTCPAGYVCTVIPTQPVSCPTGYICSPVNNGGGGGGGGGGYTASTTGATVAIVGTPTLKLTYDSSHSESALTATYNLTVTAGYSDLNLYTQIAGGSLVDQKGSSAPSSMQVTVGAGEKSNQYGDYTIVPAGHSVQMSVTINANPKQLFAGTYHGSLTNLYVFGTDGSPSPLLPVPSYSTNTVTIIGEVSPYISGFSTNQPFVPGQTVVAQGVRLDTSGGIFIDGVSIGNNAKGDNNNLGFPLPTSLTTGYHSLQIKSITTGASNSVGFQVQNNSGGSCYVFSTNLRIGNVGPDVVALQSWLLAHGYHIPAIESGKQDKGYYGNQTGDAVSKYQASVGIQERYAGYGYFGPQTRASVNANCNPVTPPTVSCPAGYICSTPSSPAVCPAGYVCTPVAIANCPDGYTCYTATPVNNGGGGGGYQFSTNLNLGSTGPDVVALQTWLIANGYNIPGIASGAVAKGYYDAQTAAAVLQFQTAVGINESGVGPITRAKLNSGTVTTTTCPAGYVCTTPTTNPPVNNSTVSFQAVFNKTFNISSVPSTATLGVAADNNYIAYVNGQYVGTGRNDSSGAGNNNFDNITNFNVAQYLHTGSNTISVTGKNYYSSAVWPSNAMGLLYKLTDQYGNTLTSSDGSESIGSATVGGGSSVVLSQPHPWWVRVNGASWIWDSADPLYQTYLSYVGQNKSTSPITIVSPTSATTVAMGESLNVIWNSSTPTQSVDIFVLNSSGQIVLKQLGLTPYSSTAQSIGFATNNTSNPITVGQYTARVCAAGTNTCTTSSTFNVIAAVANVSPVISQVGPQPTSIGSGVSIYVTNAGRQGNIVLQTQDGSKSWTTGYSTDISNLNGWSLYNGSVMSFTLPGTIGRGVGGFFNEPTVTLSAGTYNLFLTALDANNNFIKSNVATLVVGGSNVTNAPVVSSITGATQITVGGEAKWSFSATDPQGSAMTYSVNWGDNTTGSSSAVPSFKHVYASGGTYTMTMYAKDALGFTGQNTLTVTVTNPTTNPTPSVTVLSPNGGETYQAGNPVNITWSASNLTTNGQNNIELLNSSGTDFYTIYATNILTGSSYTWTPTSSFTPGNYKIRIISRDPNSGLSATDDSNGFFTITGASSQQPSVGASVVDASSDKAGIWGVFGPGAGAQNGNNPYDWHFVATVITYGKTIKSVRILSNDNWQGWSTIDPGNYPMVAYSNGSQINSSYSSLNKTGDTVTLDLYGQPETTTWPGGNILVTFTDGTTATASIPSSSVTIPAVSGQSTSVTASNLSGTLGSAVVNNNNTVAYNASFTFTLTAGNSTVYISADPSVALSASVTGSATGNLPIAGVTANPGQISGDTNVTSSGGYYVIPAGTSRQFTFNGVLQGTSGPMGFVSWQVNQINYGTSQSSLSSSNINSNLQALKVTTTLGGVASTNSSSNLTASIWDAIRAYYAH